MGVAGCAATPAAAPIETPAQPPPSLESLVQIAPDHESLLAESALPPGLHRFELASSQDVIAGGPGFLDWNGHPLLVDWADGWLRLRAIDEHGLGPTVAAVNQRVDGLQTNVVAVPGGVPWLQHWSTEGAARVGAMRIDGSETRTLLSLPSSEGRLEDVVLSPTHQGVAKVMPMSWQNDHWEPTGLAKLHLIGAAAGTVLDEPENGSLEHWGNRLFVVGDQALATYEFRNDDAELIKTVLLFIDLHTGEARKQTITDPRIEDWSYFDGEALVTQHEPPLAARADSSVLSTFEDADRIATHLAKGSAVRCAGGVWSLEEATNPQTGVERVWVQSLGAGEQRTLWEQQTRTPAQLAWSSSSVRRTRPVSCINGQLLTWGVVDPARDLVERTALLVMVAREKQL